MDRAYYISKRYTLLLEDVDTRLLREWCDDEGRNFNILLNSFLVFSQHTGFMLGRIIKYLDDKYKVNKCFDKEGNLLFVY